MEEQNGNTRTEAPEPPASLSTPVTCINLLRCNMQVSPRTLERLSFQPSEQVMYCSGMFSVRIMTSNKASGVPKHSACHGPLQKGLNAPMFGLTEVLEVVQRKDELLLSEHFSEGVRSVRKRLPGLPVRVINFDWHGMVKELREKGTVEGLWALLESIVSQVSELLCPQVSQALTTRMFLDMSRYSSGCSLAAP